MLVYSVYLPVVFGSNTTLIFANMAASDLLGDLDRITSKCLASNLNSESSSAKPIRTVINVPKMRFLRKQFQKGDGVTVGG